MERLYFEKPEHPAYYTVKVSRHNQILEAEKSERKRSDGFNPV